MDLKVPRWVRRLWARKTRPSAAHLVRGRLGEKTARQYLQGQGLRFLTANYRTRRGEIDLIFQDGDCLVFVEVKTRSPKAWTRPARAVNAHRKRRLSRTAMDYLQRIGAPAVRMRFDIVEVLLEGSGICEVRHLVNAFPLVYPYRYV